MSSVILFRFTNDLRWKNGFTLLEVMIAVSILAIALVALFGSQSRSLSLATEAHFNNTAPMLASLKISEIQSRIIPLENDEGDFGDDFSSYSWEIEVSDAVLGSFDSLDNIENPLQQVIVTVSWQETNYRYSIMYYELPK